MGFDTRTTSRGFTLIETFVAVSILMFAVIGPLTLAQQGLSSAYYARDQIAAFYLAQEGIESVRYTRDLNVASGEDWLEGLDTCMSSDGCKVDILTFTLSDCSGECERLRYDNVSHFYGYDPAWDETKFRRTITVDQLSDQEVSVSVTITWVSALIPRQFTAQENLFNWN